LERFGSLAMRRRTNLGPSRFSTAIDWGSVWLCTTFAVERER